MNPMDILNLFFKYSLLHLYTPIINTVGFSHPLTFTIITAHNTFSLTYLLLAVAVAYPTFHKKSWLIPVAVTTAWITISINIITTLNIPATTAIVTILPHGWLEFTAIVYWTNAIRETAQNNNPPKTIDTPTFGDYLKVLTKPKQLVTLAKTDVQVSFTTTKLSFKILCKSLKKAYITTLILIATAALIETYLTPNIMFLISNL
jgi:hypothetical protein